MACDGRVRRSCSCADVDWKESCLGDFRLPLLAVVRLSGVRDHALGVCSVADIMYFRKSPGQAFLLSTQLLVVVRRESLVPDVGLLVFWFVTGECGWQFQRSLWRNSDLPSSY